MSRVPGYLQRARRANRTTPAAAASSAREKSERSEQSRRFEPGHRYEVKGPMVGVIHRSTLALDLWRDEVGLPRAGLMTVEGELVLVADVRAAMRTGWIDVVGIPPGVEQ